MSDGVAGVSEARSLAQRCLARLGTRWAHTEGVAAAAQRASQGLLAHDADALLAAAWLHDIGYATESSSGLHALDGARAALDHGFGARVASLVAHHSAARVEAAERGLEAELGQFRTEQGPVPDSLAWADMTTSPSGTSVRPEERIGEILARYRPNDPVHRAAVAARAELLAASARTEERLRTAPVNPGRAELPLEGHG